MTEKISNYFLNMHKESTYVFLAKSEKMTIYIFELWSHATFYLFIFNSNAFNRSVLCMYVLLNFALKWRKDLLLQKKSIFFSIIEYVAIFQDILCSFFKHIDHHFCPKEKPTWSTILSHFMFIWSWEKKVNTCITTKYSLKWLF